MKSARSPFTYTLGEKLAGLAQGLVLLLALLSVLAFFGAYFVMLWREAFP